MTIIYVADGARVSPPKNQWQKNDHAKWLMGKPVGELIDSELNPKVFYNKLIQDAAIECTWASSYRVYAAIQIASKNHFLLSKKAIQV